MLAVIEGTLGELEVECTDEACVGVVMSSGGYPEAHKTGYPISGLGDVDDDINVFHAGTKLVEDNEVLTSGGRILTVVGMGKTLDEAREKVYDNISRIHFEGCHYRKDIALMDQTA
jgi:phosphoribosylamine--glycine ligase